MTSPQFAVEPLRAALAAMPPGTLVPRDWVLEQLKAGVEGGLAPAPSRIVDLTIRDLAGAFGKSPSTVRAWLERGDFPGAYKLNGKQWRIPASAVEAFQFRQRGPVGPLRRDGGRLSAWRSVRLRGSARLPQSGPGAVTVRSPTGNAEE